MENCVECAYKLLISGEYFKLSRVDITIRKKLAEFVIEKGELTLLKTMIQHVEIERNFYRDPRMQWVSYLATNKDRLCRNNKHKEIVEFLKQGKYWDEIAGEHGTKSPWERLKWFDSRL